MEKLGIKLGDCISFLDKKRIDNKSLFMFVAIVIVALIGFYYMPFLTFLSDSNFWISLYNVIDPFIVVPYILGFISIFVFACYKSVCYKVLIDFLYALGIMISFVSVMGMRYWWEGLIFVPHAIFIILQVIIVVKRSEVIE